EVRKPDLHVRGVRVVVAAQLRAEAAKLADVDLAPVPVEQLDEAAHVRALALVRDRYAHVDLGDGVLDAAGPIEHADRIAEALHPRPIERKPARVPLAVDVAERGYGAAERRFRSGSAARLHSSSSPRRIVTALPPIQPRGAAGTESGADGDTISWCPRLCSARISTSMRPGRPISSPCVNTRRRGSSAGCSSWMSAPSCPAAL